MPVFAACHLLHHSIREHSWLVQELRGRRLTAGFLGVLLRDGQICKALVKSALLYLALSSGDSWTLKVLHICRLYQIMRISILFSTKNLRPEAWTKPKIRRYPQPLCRRRHQILESSCKSNITLRLHNHLLISLNVIDSCSIVDLHLFDRRRCHFFNIFLKYHSLIGFPFLRHNWFLCRLLFLPIF